MSVDPQYLKVGMEVVGSDGDLAGTIKEIHASEFHLDRPMSRDVLVPFEAIQASVDASGTHAGNPRVVLVIRADSVGIQNWPHPE